MTTQAKKTAKSTAEDLLDYIKTRLNETTAESMVMSVILAGIIMFSRNMMMNWADPAIVRADRTVLNWYFFIFFAVLSFKLARKILVAYWDRRSVLNNDRRELRNKQLEVEIQEKELHLIEIREKVKDYVAEAIKKHKEATKSSASSTGP